MHNCIIHMRHYMFVESEVYDSGLIEAFFEDSD